MIGTLLNIFNINHINLNFLNSFSEGGGVKKTRLFIFSNWFSKRLREHETCQDIIQVQNKIPHVQSYIYTTSIILHICWYLLICTQYRAVFQGKNWFNLGKSAAYQFFYISSYYVSQKKKKRRKKRKKDWSISLKFLIRLLIIYIEYIICIIYEKNILFLGVAWAGGRGAGEEDEGGEELPGKETKK